MRRESRAFGKQSEVRNQGRLADRALLLLPLAAHLLFQWMFLSAEGLERTADAAHLRSALDSDARSAARRFAYEWRHGMAGRWPFFVPGFFALAVCSALWAHGKASGRLLGEGVVVLSAATLIARALAGFGSRRLIRSFQRRSGIECEGEAAQSTWAGAGIGGLTAASWSALVIAAQRSVATRRLWPLALPLALYALLTAVRSSKLSSLDLLWLSKLVEGDRRAIRSLVLAFVTAGALWRHAGAGERREERTSR